MATLTAGIAASNYTHKQAQIITHYKLIIGGLIL